MIAFVTLAFRPLLVTRRVGAVSESVYISYSLLIKLDEHASAKRGCVPLYHTSFMCSLSFYKVKTNLELH